MATFLMRRILLSFVVLMLVTVVTFTIAHAVPGDPLATVVSDRVNDPRVMEAYRRKFGLDKPITVQYVYYMKNLIRGDLGLSITEDPVHVNDLQATILHCLGLDHTRLTYRHMGRDFRLTDVHGTVVRKILA